MLDGEPTEEQTGEEMWRGLADTPEEVTHEPGLQVQRGRGAPACRCERTQKSSGVAWRHEWHKLRDIVTLTVQNGSNCSHRIHLA